MDHEARNNRCKHWQVNITIDEDDDLRARAVAQMQYRGRTVVGIGRSQADPGDHVPDEVGDEIAVGRALSDLTRHLFAATASDIESVAGEAVSIRS